MKASARPASSPLLNQTTQPAAEGSARSNPVDIPKISKSKWTVSCSTDASSSHSYPRSLSSSLSPSLRKTLSHWIKAEPTVNVHTTCSRHTDQFFGGPSLAELARSVVKKRS